MTITLAAYTGTLMQHEKATNTQSNMHNNLGQVHPLLLISDPAGDDHPDAELALTEPASSSVQDTSGEKPCSAPFRCACIPPVPFIQPEENALEYVP